MYMYIQLCMEIFRCCLREYGQHRNRNDNQFTLFSICLFTIYQKELVTITMHIQKGRVFTISIIYFFLIVTC
jgi:hypothetical protein